MMSTSSLKSGYMVCTDETPVTIYTTRKEAEEHIDFQLNHMHSWKTWYIVDITLSNWQTFKPKQHEGK